jgi:drug/metabolite transporter (DMT)-like permease
MSELTAAGRRVGMPSASRRERLFAVSGILLAMLIFGGMFVAGREAALAGLAPADLVTLRFLVVGPLFAPLLLKHGIGGLGTLGGVGWVRGSVLASLGGAPLLLANMAGVHFASAAHGAIISPGVTAIAGLLFARCLLGGRVHLGAVFGIALIVVGLALVAGAEFWIFSPDTLLGDAFLAAAGLFHGLFTVLLRYWRIAPVAVTAVVSVLSAVVWLPCYFLLTGLEIVRAAPVAEIALQALVQGLLAGAFAVFLYTHAVAVLGSSKAALFPALVPVFGIVLAAGLLGEHVSLFQCIGIAGVVLGMLVAARRSHGH